MAKLLLALTLLAALLVPATPRALAGEEDAIRLYRSGTEPVVFLLHETFPSQAALDDQTRTIFPAFQREHGPIPAGIVARPVVPKRFREVRE
jgi:hypothetical protein